MSNSHGKILRDIIKSSELTQDELAAKMDTTRQTLHNWIKEEKFPQDRIEKIIKAFDLSNDYFDTVKKIVKQPRNFNVIVVPLTFQMGPGQALPDLEHASEYPKEFIWELGDGVHYAVEVEGDSMYPTMSSRDRVYIQKFNHLRYIRWGEVYAIISKTNKLKVKRVMPSNLDGYVLIVSDNENYPAYDMPIDDIDSMWLVKKAITDNLGKREIKKV